MPLKSKAQLKKFGEMVKNGEMTKKVFDRWIKDTPNIHHLPDKVADKKVKTVKTIK